MNCGIVWSLNSSITELHSGSIGGPHPRRGKCLPPPSKFTSALLCTKINLPLCPLELLDGTFYMFPIERSISLQCIIQCHNVNTSLNFVCLPHPLLISNHLLPLLIANTTFFPFSMPFLLYRFKSSLSYCHLIFSAEPLTVALQAWSNLKNILIHTLPTFKTMFYVCNGRPQELHCPANSKSQNFLLEPK